MCTTICFLGCAPGSRTPSQVPTMRGGSAAMVRTGAIAKPSISVNPKQSWSQSPRCLFTVDLLCVFRISYRNIRLSAKRCQARGADREGFVPFVRCVLSGDGRGARLHMSRCPILASGRAEFASARWAGWRSQRHRTQRMAKVKTKCAQAGQLLLVQTFVVM